MADLERKAARESDPEWPWESLETTAARIELARLEELARANRLKTYADFRALDTARHRVAALAGEG